MTNKVVTKVKKNVFTVLTPEAADQLTFLKNNIEPWNVVELTWRETYELRQRQLELGNTSIATYFKEYRALQQPLGYHLVCILQQFLATLGNF